MRCDNIICRFVHASDLHIGRFQYTNPYIAMDYIHAFQYLLLDARRNSVDFILLAGDVFNSLDLLPYYFSQIVNLLRSFHQKTSRKTPIVAIEGNHDIRSFSKGNRISKNLSWLKVLSNLHLITLLDDDLDDLDRNSQPVRFNEANLYGNTYCGEKIDVSMDLILKNIPRNKGFNILLNHFGLEGQMNGIPGQSKGVLDEKVKPYIHYLGTGHFHKQYLLDYIFNPGCLSPACLSDYNLPHGYFLVKVTKENKYDVQITKKRVHERNLLWKTLTIKSKPNSKHILFASIENFLKKVLPIRCTTFKFTHQEDLPILCLSIRSPSGKLLSNAVKKELRALILKDFQVVECYLFQKQINYKSIEDFFPI